MADRVHPHESPSNHPARNAAPPAGAKGPAPEAPPPLGEFPSRSLPPSGTYVVQVPKDQIYRVPSPENARRFQDYSNRALRHRRSCLACSAAAALLLLLLLILAAVAGVLFLVLRPVFPDYSVDRLAVKALNFTSGEPLAPEFDATVRAENPNKKVGIEYQDGSYIAVSYSDVTLGNGLWPVFYQGPRNVTALRTALTGSGVRLSAAMQRDLTEDQRRNAVPLVLDVRVPVRVKFGAVTSWTITVKVRCQITVDNLTADSRIVSKTCKTDVDM